LKARGGYILPLAFFLNSHLMNITATITANCKHINFVLTGAPGQAIVTVINDTHVYAVPIVVPSSGTINQLIYLPSTVGTGNGIFRITANFVNGDTAYAGVFGSCDLDCCMAKKIDKLLECGCGCVKCNDSLTQAERVHLLIAGIRADLSQIGSDNAINTAVYTKAIQKYKKGLELCSDGCGCSC
jgi:hypothetical protein